MDSEKLIQKCGTFCMILIFGSLSLGFLAAFTSLIYLFVCLCR